MFLLLSWDSRLSYLIQEFIPSESDFGSILNVIVLSLILGLILNAIRWALYEQCFLRKSRLSSGHFRNLTDDESIRAIEGTIDENFRYHQFYGSSSLIVPLFLIYIFSITFPLNMFTFWSVINIFLVCAAFLLLEIVIVFASVTSFLRYVNRSISIMKGG